MALIKKVRNKTPRWGADTYLSENATLIGDVQMGDQCSIWFNAVLRGDVHSITLGNQVNIQDGAVIHCTYQKHPTVLGDCVSVGHNALVHGCEIKSNVLIGMGAIVMDGVVIESNVIIAAGSVVLQGTHVPTGTVWAGVPAKKVKDVSAELLHDQIERIAENYIHYSSWYSEE